MNNSIYLRPLRIADADISYKWRNNPLVWQFTKFNPANQVTRTVEAAWLENVLKVKTDYRFAICLKESGKYLGNIQLINVKRKNADLHLFIGDPAFWGKGIGKEATRLLLEYGFTHLRLRCITLEVHKDNFSAQSVYKRAGFQTLNENGDFIVMSISSANYKELLKKGTDFGYNKQELMRHLSDGFR